MKVSDVMTEAAVTDRADESLGQAAKRMWEQQTGSILLVDGDRLLGILTERDVLQAVAEGRELSTPVSEVMSKDLVTVDPRPRCATRRGSWPTGGSATSPCSTTTGWSAWCRSETWPGSWPGPSTSPRRSSS